MAKDSHTEQAKTTESTVLENSFNAEILHDKVLLLIVPLVPGSITS